MPDLAATLRPVRLSQAGRDLGDAPEGAFGEGLADAFPAVAVLGADSPTLTPEILLEPFAAGADVALGPCQDGGYYLLAATSLHVGLFRDTPWSTDLVAAETLRHCRALGLQTRVLPTWCDVDVALDRLRADLRQAPASSAAARSVLAALPGGPARSWPGDMVPDGSHHGRLAAGSLAGTGPAAFTLASGRDAGAIWGPYLLQDATRAALSPPEAPV